MMDAIMLVIAMLNDVKSRQIKLYEDYTSNRFDCLKWDDSRVHQENIRRYYMIKGKIQQVDNEIEDLEKLLKDLEGRFNEKT